jgi:tetratricopeptide (TPR) repeat protein
LRAGNVAARLGSAAAHGSRVRLRRMARKRVVAAMLVASLLACAGPVYERRWVEVSTPNFTILSTLDDDETLRLARDLEWFRALVHTATTTARADSPVPTRIFVFDNEYDFARFRAGGDVLGFFRPGMRANQIALVDTRAIDVTRAVLHEQVHFVLRNATAIQYPPWYDEGFAEFLSTATIEGDRVIVGAFPKDRIPVFQYSRWMPVSRIISVRSYEDVPRDQLAMFYAQSWALVHYLTLDREGEHSFGQEMKRYLDRVEQGSSDDDAFETAFGEPPALTGRRLCKILTSGSLKGVAIPLSALNHDPPEARIRPLSELERAVRLGELALVGGDGARAEELFSAALVVDPDASHAHTGLADAYRFQDQWDRAVPRYARANELAGDDALVQLDIAEYHHANALRDEMVERRSELLGAARRHYVKSQRLDPSIPETYAMYGATFLAPGEDPTRGLATLEHANALLPSNVQILDMLAEAYVASERIDDAKTVLERRVSWSEKGGFGRIDEIIEEIRVRRTEAENPGDVPAGS